jgi:hypothetical protein
MAQSSRRRSTVKDAIDDIVRRLLAVPASPETAELGAKAEACLHEAESWTGSQPSRKEKEELMRRVLELHLHVAKLERGGDKK